MAAEKIDYSWKVLKNENKKTPPVRCNMAGGVYDEHLWILMGAGAGTGRSNEVWKFSLKNQEWMPITASGDIPTARDGHTATFIGGGKFLLFGGQGVPTVNLKAHKAGGEGGASKIKTMLAREVFNDVHEFNCATMTWTPLFPHGTPPISRRLHSANFINYDDVTMTGALAVRNGIAAASAGGQHRRGMNNAIPSKHTGGSKPNTGNAAQQGIPDKSLVIYGGCGIEPSKKTEQVFNDLWVFAMERKEGKGEWVNLTTRGAVPRPQSGHKSELIGETLVVVGGIPATPFSLSKADQGLSSTLATITSDVMTLNVRNLTWSYVDLRDPVGRRVKLNLHGHSLSRELSDSQNTHVLIFGGKTTAADSTQHDHQYRPKEPISHTLWQLDVVTGTTTPLHAKGSVKNPENRYGHLGVCTFGQSVSESRRDGTTRPFSASAKPKQVLVIFGGSALDAGGFVDPEVYALYRSVRTGIDPVDEVGVGQGTQGSVGSQYSGASVVSSYVSQGRSGSPALSAERSTLPPVDEYDMGMDQSDGRRPQKTIWQRLHGGGGGGGAISVVSNRQPSGSWGDLKLALSYPTTQRENSANIVIRPEVITTADNNALSAGINASTSLTIGATRRTKPDKSTRALLSGPDALRIGALLKKEIYEMTAKQMANSPSRRPLAATLLSGENPHNYETTTLKGDVSTKLMRTLSVGTGAKSLLGPASTLDLDTMRVKFRPPGYAGLNALSVKNLPQDVVSSHIERNRKLSKAIFPIVKGLDFKEAKTAYLTKFPPPSDDGPFLVASALSLNN